MSLTSSLMYFKLFFSFYYPFVSYFKFCLSLYREYLFFNDLNNLFCLSLTHTLSHYVHYSHCLQSRCLLLYRRLCVSHFTISLSITLLFRLCQSLCLLLRLYYCFVYRFAITVSLYLLSLCLSLYY